MFPGLKVEGSNKSETTPLIPKPAPPPDNLEYTFTDKNGNPIVYGVKRNENYKRPRSVYIKIACFGVIAAIAIFAGVMGFFYWYRGMPEQKAIDSISTYYTPLTLTNLLNVTNYFSFATYPFVAANYIPQSARASFATQATLSSTFTPLTTTTAMNTSTLNQIATMASSLNATLYQLATLSSTSTPLTTTVAMNATWYQFLTNQLATLSSTFTPLTTTVAMNATLYNTAQLLMDQTSSNNVSLTNQIQTLSRLYSTILETIDTLESSSIVISGLLSTASLAVEGTNSVDDIVLTNVPISSSASGGTASMLPTQPAGFITITVSGVPVKIAYYNL